MYKFFTILFVLTFLLSCHKGKKVDLIIHNAKIYTQDSEKHVWEAIAILDGQIVEVGPERQILNRYRADESIDVKGRSIYPGLIDSDFDLMNLARRRSYQDLSGVRTIPELSFKIELLENRSNGFLVASQVPSSLFESHHEGLTVLFERFKKMKLVLFNEDFSKVMVSKSLYQDHTAFSCEPGNYVVLDGDVAILEAFLPQVKQSELFRNMSDLQEELIQLGVVSIHTKNLTPSEIQQYKSFVSKYPSELRISASLAVQSRGTNKISSSSFLQEDRFSVRSVNYRVKPEEVLDEDLLNFCRNQDLGLILDQPTSTQIKEFIIYLEKVKFQKFNLRWRIDGISEIGNSELKRLAEFGIYPGFSFGNLVNGKASLYPSLLDLRVHGGMLALGSASHNIHVGIYQGMYSLINGVDKLGKQVAAYTSQKTLTLEQLIHCFTLDNAYALQQEKYLGSVEANKEATFIVCDKPILNTAVLVDNYAVMTFIKGKKVYSFE